MRFQDCCSFCGFGFLQRYFDNLIHYQTNRYLSLSWLKKLNSCHGLKIVYRETCRISSAVQTMAIRWINKIKAIQVKEVTKIEAKRMKTRQSPNETGSPLSSEDSTSIINHDPASFYSTSNPARVSKSTAEPQTTETSSSNENISNISISTTPTGCYSSPKDVISKKSMVMKSFPAFGASSTSLPVPVLPSSFIQNNQKTPETGIDGKKNSFSILFYSS